METKGRTISEEELRAYIYCSEYFAFGGKYTPNSNTKIMQRAFELITVNALRKEKDLESFDVHNILIKQIYKELGPTHLEPQIVSVQNKLLLALNDVAKAFPLTKYIVASPVTLFNVKVGKLLIRLHVSGLYRSKENKTVHAVCWSPYLDTQAFLNDPTNHLKLHVLKTIANQRFGVNKVRLHIFSVTKKGAIIYFNISTKDIKDTFLKRVEQLVEAMEANFHFPLVPCNHACEFKAQCQPKLSV